MKLTKFALNRPVTVLMAFLAIILIGLISWQRLSIELMPSMNYPQLTILTSYENVAPPEIESLISKPVEEAVGTVTGIKRITSTSKEGFSLVTMDFEWGVDMNLSALDVREKIDLIKGALPRDMGNPVIVKFDPSSSPIITLGISGQTDLAELTKIASEEIKQKLERIKGVALARISGAVEREILISVDQGRLFAYKILISAVVEKLKEANFNFPGGKIEKTRNEIRIRTIGQFENLAEIENVVLTKINRKTPIFLRDVASVTDTFKKKTSSFMINGKKSIGISIFKQADSNTVQIADELTRVLNKLQKKLSPKVNIVIVYNQATFIKDSISDLQWAGIFGGILAFSVLFLFLRSFQSAIIITTAIPISVIGAFGLMYMSGITLNIMSLGGLALGVGLLVDNGIVILENIHRHRKNITNIHDAVLTGTSEMQKPVLASTFAHIIVFLPIIFVKGMAGNFFFQLALTISFSLIISILVALVLNPVLEAKRGFSTGTLKTFLTTSKPSWSLAHVILTYFKTALEKSDMILRPLFSAIDRGMKASEKFYLKILSFALVNRKKVLLITLFAIIMSVSMLPLMGKEFIPHVDQGSFVIKVTTPSGTTLSSTEAVMVKIGKILKKESEVKDVFINIGYDKKEKAEKALGEMGSNIARMTVVLNEKKKRSIGELVDAIRKEISKIPEIETDYILNQDITRLLKQKQNAPEILEIGGPDLETIKKLTQKVIGKLEKIESLKDVKSSLGKDETEIQISVDREKAAGFKLSIKNIADTIKIAMEGKVATKFHDSDQEVDIVVKLRDEDKNNINKLSEIFIHTPFNTDIPLKEVASLSLSKRLRQIQRHDMSRVSIISANILGITFSQGLNEVKAGISDISIPADHFISFSDEQKKMNESFKNLGFALMLSVLLVYMLLASLFESFLHPFIIMFAVPPAVVGVILFLLITGNSISLGVYIGSIMLGGIVVNNSIILVDYTDSLRKKGFSRNEAIIEGGRVRLRPILMTAMTTILGLTPLAIGFGSGAEIRSPLAITVIGGLTTSTVMTLILIPVIYSILDDLKNRYTSIQS